MRDPRRPGDRFVRVPRLKETQPVVIRASGRSKRRSDFLYRRSPILFLLALLAFVGVGTALLMAPFSTTSGHFAPFLTALFTATSGLTTTGLTLETTATYWSFFGQFVILVLMFLGGLGFIAAVTFLLMVVGHQFRLPERLAIGESIGASAGGLFRLLRHILVLDLAVTGIGIIPLLIRFHHYLPWASALWQAVFTSVSAFNTAGFDIVGATGLTPYRADPYILGTVTVVACIGSIGYTVTLELLSFKRWNRLTLNTRLVVIVSLASWILGSLAFFIYDRSSPQTLGAMSTPVAGLTAVFNGISASTTTGFATIDFSKIVPGMLIITTLLMFIGGAAGSTAGGIKVNTLSVLLVVAISSFKGRPRAQVFWREVPYDQVARAVTVTLVATFLVGLSLLILMSEGTGQSLLFLLFDAVSAFGTVGLSTGALAHLPVAGDYVMIVLMLVGRLGVLTLILALTVRSRASVYKVAREAIALG